LAANPLLLGQRGTMRTLGGLPMAIPDPGGFRLYNIAKHLFIADAPGYRTCSASRSDWIIEVRMT